MNRNTDMSSAVAPGRFDADQNDAYYERVQAAMSKLVENRKARWASYGLPHVTPLASFADYSEAARRRQEIAVQRTACQQELASANLAMTRGFLALRDDETEQQARDIIAGQPEKAFEGFEELKAQVARLNQRLNAFARAISMQDEVVATIRSERSIDAAQEMDAAHRDAVLAIADAANQLRTAFDREEAARSLVREAGYDQRLPSFAEHLLKFDGILEHVERRSREYVR